MAYLLEILGRGLVSSLRGALQTKLPALEGADVADLRRRHEDNPKDTELAVGLGLQLLWEDQYLPAERVFLDILAIDDESIQALLGLACVHDAMGRTEQTLGLLDRARLIDILDPVILFCVGFCCEKLGRLDDAIDAYRASLRGCPDLRNSHERLAAIFLKQGRTEQVLHHYKQLVELDPGCIPDRLAIANLHLSVGDTESAVRQYETAIALDPDNWGVEDDMVSAYEQAGLFREGIELLHKMIEDQPEFADHHLRLGDLYAKVGDDPAAREQYAKALEIHPEYLEAMVKLGTTELRSGKPEEAAQLFAQAVEINDRLLTACVGLGVAQLQAGRTEEGLDSFELASKVEPNSSLLFSETARMQLKAAVGDQLERYLGVRTQSSEPVGGQELAGLLIDKQIERHQEAIRGKPMHADLHYRLGLLLSHRGRGHEAIKAYSEAVRINPAYEKALVKLGMSLRAIGRTEEAIRHFQQALQINPDDVQLHYQLGLIFAEKNLFELAVEHFQKACHGAPDQENLRANLSLALQNAGLMDRAEMSWRTTVDLGEQVVGRGVTLN